MFGLSAPTNAMRISLALVVVLLVGPALSLSQQASRDRTALAKDFLLAAYPELAGRKLMVTVVSDGLLESDGPLSTFGIDVGETQTTTAFGANPKALKPKMMATLFAFSPKGYVTWFVLNSPSWNARQRELEKQAAAHPEWGNEEVLRALREAGARYGPDKRNELLRALPLGKIEPFLGKLTVRSLEFDLGFDRLPSGDSSGIGTLQWILEAESRQEGKRKSYHLTFEPFEGKLASIRERTVVR